ncbi:hypothetical protein WJX74_005891 [Apatococcus lobatus]|uniref:Uncharacterized protein n=1 Tax=Apatococcus lobatus TaxID=904363 RepID=A0AAW1SFV5_9CHLO
MQYQSALCLFLCTSVASGLTALADKSSARPAPASPQHTARQLAQQNDVTHRTVLSAEAKSGPSSHAAQSLPASGAIPSLAFDASGDKEAETNDTSPRRDPALDPSSLNAARAESAAISIQAQNLNSSLQGSTTRADNLLGRPHEAAEEHSGSLVKSNIRSHSLLSTASAGSSIPFSSHECWWEGTPEEEENFKDLTPASHHTVCNYTNLLIWNQQVFYVAKQPHPRLPKVRMAYEGSMWIESLDIKIVSPDDFPEAWPAAPSQRLPAVLFWYISHFGNYGHIFSEHAPNMHVLACNFLGFCDYKNTEQRQNLHILFTNTIDKWLVGQWPPQIDEMWPCWSEHRPTLLHDHPPERQDQLILVEYAAAGIGPKCRSIFFCRPFFGAGPPAADDMEGFRKRMTACMGIPGDTTLDYLEPPVVAVMNRQHGKGRSIHNGDELAAVYNQIAVLVQVHGAGLANAIFLPQGAVVVDIMQKGFYARISWSMRSVRDYKNLQLGYIPLAEQMSHLLPISLDSPEYQDLTPEERVRVDNADCPRPELQETCTRWWWYGSSIIVDGIQAEQAVWMAMHHVGRGRP